MSLDQYVVWNPTQNNKDIFIDRVASNVKAGL